MNISETQSNLVLLGYGGLLGRTGVDGKNGKNTRKAVKSFQKDFNKIFNDEIKVDGIAGIQTERAFNLWLLLAGKKGTRNFNIKEFENKGKGNKMLSNGMDRHLITGLERLRFVTGNKAIKITSGYRNKEHNRLVGGSSNSQHLYGKAADIKIKGVTPQTVYKNALGIFNGVGKYNTFTHVDTRSQIVRFKG